MEINTSLFKDGGVYVIAISGGVDSVVLLKLLVESGISAKWVVAHFDHGMRTDSAADAEFVKALARKNSLECMLGAAQLGSDTSEATARAARYDFLRTVKAEYRAEAVVTAHHQDDVIETMLINLIRGTNRKGLTSLRSNNALIRPLLMVPKKDIVRFAQASKMEWREDLTNQDERYLRNYVRKRIATRLGENELTDLIEINAKMQTINDNIDATLVELIESMSLPEKNALDRYIFTMLPKAIALEVLNSVITNTGEAISRVRLVELWLAIKTARNNTVLDVARKQKLQINLDSFSFIDAGN